ncbi:MAG: hypothetical protein KF678_15105 [Phycisphaeraceae bacterium]|nr:hypothetical protein [Phycisphaeraceae bacterium]
MTGRKLAVAQVGPASTEIILYSLTGHAGTTTTMLNPAGVVQAQYSFDPYGEVRKRWRWRRRRRGHRRNADAGRFQ